MHSMDELVRCAAQLGKSLEARGRMIVTVESCTGGMIAMALSETPGSSAWLDRGFVTYTNEAKVELVEVPPALIAENGAVSREVACAMAIGGLKRAPMAFLALSVTGIAGPSGGTVAKPVGTVVHGFAWRSSAQDLLSRVQARHYPGDRREVRLAASIFALRQGLLLLDEALPGG